MKCEKTKDDSLKNFLVSSDGDFLLNQVTTKHILAYNVYYLDLNKKIGTISFIDRDPTIECIFSSVDLDDDLILSNDNFISEDGKVKLVWGSGVNFMVREIQKRLKLKKG